MRKKSGDTLIEVTLAVGIFSMVAVAIVSVVNNSTSSAQAALETTLAREEIDIQAEALRFIQNSYISSANQSSGDNRYAALWQAITANAIGGDDVSSDITVYRPSSCAEIYSGETLKNQKAFIIDPSRLSADDPTTAIFSATGSKLFQPASTYPHLIYQESESTTGRITTTLSFVEGIYVVAVKDTSTTTIVSDSDISKQSAYYDFYIRTCWYGPGAKLPSTISTVIRLYNPDISSGNASNSGTFPGNKDSGKTSDNSSTGRT